MSEAQVDTVPAHRLIDAALSSRVLVYGSLPPHGRDLDLLARASERHTIEASLTAAGFQARGAQWARFAECSAEIVELADPTSWDLPGEELQTLFAEGHPLDGCRNLVRPAPHHVLLILARRLAAADGVLDEKRRARLEQSCSEDARAWETARERAPRWQAQAALAALEHAHRSSSSSGGGGGGDDDDDGGGGGGGAASSALLSAARRERRQRLRRARPGLRRWLARARELRRRAPRRGTVVALSGLDGAGKSSQAAGLQDALRRLGFDACVVRTRISWEDWLWQMVPPLKRIITPPVRALAMLRSLARKQPSSKAAAAVQAQPGAGATPLQAQPDAAATRTPEPEDDPVRLMRESSPLLTDVWTLVITLANAWSQWRLMYRQLARGGIVICDRYTLDSIVELRYAYGGQRPFKPQRAVLALLYPKPVRAYFLDVSPSTALERKGEWGEEWLARHRELYLEECPRLGVAVLDGEQPQADICAQIAREVWLSGV